ncbi:LysR family transcriptional regulator [Streptomyces chartreusis]|uniref:LysR family transcriptional regulator n=1 Tax=Streptomyces chartreusis TaxID=1969 RepID=UPI0033E20A7C
METRRLEYFVVLTSERHFRKAAARLHISQSALSQQIQRLERDLGTQLIDRSATEFELTAAGERVLRQSRAVLDRMDELAGVASDARAGRVGRLRIGISHSMLYGQTPSAILKYRRTQPAVEVELRIAPTPEVHEMLRLAQVEVGFSYTPPHSDELAFREVYRDPYLVVLPDDHLLADESELELAQLKEQNLLLSPRRYSPEAYDAIIGACIEAGFSAHDIVNEQSSYIDQVGLVAAGMGITLLPERLGRVKMPGVRFVPLASSLQSRFLLCWNHTVVSPTRDAFRTMAARVLSEN